MTPQRELHKQIYYCAFPGNVSKEIIIWHPLSVLKQMKTHCNLHSYWKDLQDNCTSLDTGNPLERIQYPVMFEKLASSGPQIPAHLRLPGWFLPFNSNPSQAKCIHCRTTMWQPGMNFSPPFIPQSLPSDKSSCPDFKEIPKRHSCCYISRTPASTNQENGFQVQTASLPLPHHFKIWWLCRALSWRGTIGGTGG